MEQGGPEPLGRVADVGEAEGVEQHCANQHQQAAADHDGPEGRAHTAYTELIQRSSLIDALPQAGASLHKTLQERADGHEPQTASNDQGRQHELAEKGQFRADINDRQAGHRDG